MAKIAQPGLAPAQAEMLTSEGLKGPKRAEMLKCAIVTSFELVTIALEHGANGLAHGRGVDLVVRGEPEGQVAYPAPGAVDQDDLTRA